MGLTHINLLTPGACLRCGSLTLWAFIGTNVSLSPHPDFKAIMPQMALWKSKQKTSWLVRGETFKGIIKDNSVNF